MYSAAAGSACPVRRLSPRQVEALQAYVDDRRGEAVRLAELAGVARMPVKPFVEAFHAAFGTTPARFVTAARLGRAGAAGAHRPDTGAGVVRPRVQEPIAPDHEDADGRRPHPRRHRPARRAEPPPG